MYIVTCTDIGACKLYDKYIHCYKERKFSPVAHDCRDRHSL